MYSRKEPTDDYMDNIMLILEKKIHCQKWKILDFMRNCITEHATHNTQRHKEY